MHFRLQSDTVRVEEESHLVGKRAGRAKAVREVSQTISHKRLRPVKRPYVLPALLGPKSRSKRTFRVLVCLNRRMSKPSAPRPRLGKSLRFCSMS